MGQWSTVLPTMLWRYEWQEDRLCRSDSVRFTIMSEKVLLRSQMQYLALLLELGGNKCPKLPHIDYKFTKWFNRTIFYFPLYFGFIKKLIYNLILISFCGAPIPIEHVWEVIERHDFSVHLAMRMRFAIKCHTSGRILYTKK